MDRPSLEQLISSNLAERLAHHQLRRRRPVVSLSATRLLIDGTPFINFASNDYLGLSHHPAVIRAAAQAAQRHGAGSGASALITGYTDVHRSCEHALAHWKRAEDAVLLPSGYQANLAAIQTLAAVAPRAGGVRFLIDKLAHASLVDAVRGAGAEFRIFPHNHMVKLQRLLEHSPAGQLQVVLTESIFSMDGDAADLPAIAAIKEKFPFVLVLDEAHASGVYGPGGAGYAAEIGLEASVNVSIVTLSKALGCGGGAVCASAGFCETLVNHGRAYIYSTSISPGIAAAVEAAIGVIRDEPQRQQRLRELAARLRLEAARLGWDIAAGDSPIIPIILGEESQALRASESLAAAGLLVAAVRPPTVPRGSSRLRVTLSCEHTDDDADRLLRALQHLRPSAP